MGAPRRLLSLSVHGMSPERSKVGWVDGGLPLLDSATLRVSNRNLESCTPLDGIHFLEIARVKFLLGSRKESQPFPNVEQGNL